MTRLSRSVRPTTARFEECLERLEGIVRELEGGELPLERALQLFEEGVKLSRTCLSRLDEAEKKITMLLAGEDGSLVEKPFSPESGPDGGDRDG